MFGFLKEDNGFVSIANRLFETKLYNLFLAESEVHNELNPPDAKSQFIVQGMLQMDLVMQKFYQYFEDITVRGTII